MIDLIGAPTLYAALLALMLVGGPVGLVIGLGWFLIGAWFVTNTDSRGFLADAAFLVTWPIWLIVEGV